MRGVRRRDAAWWVRAYAGTTGAALISLGGAGLLFLPGRAPAGSLFQISVGALFVIAGLAQRDAVVTRRFVGGMGVLLLLGVAAAVCARLLLGAGALGLVQGTCLIVGIASVLVARRAEPGVLLAAVSAFGAGVVAAITATTAHVRRRRNRRRAAPAEEPTARPAEEGRGKPGGKRRG